MSAGYETLHLDDVPLVAFAAPDEPDWKPLRHTLGVGAFGVNAWVAKAAGEHVIERHDEDPGDAAIPGHEELYVVLRGSAEFTVGEDSFDVHTGSIVFVRDPKLMRQAIASEAGTTVLTVGAAPGQAYAPSEWEGRWLEKEGLA